MHPTPESPRIAALRAKTRQFRISLERLSILPDGRRAHLLRKPRRNGATHLLMTPVQLLARVSALIPPPRFSLQSRPPEGPLPTVAVATAVEELRRHVAGQFVLRLYGEDRPKKLL